MSNVMYPTPNIVRESSTGIQFVSIVDEMFARREIECVGPIDATTTYSLCQQLRQLQQSDPTDEITIYFNSPGGEVQSGLAIYDTMQAISCPIRTVCLGMAASMAALLFMAGAQRDMLPHARILIHDPLLAGGVGGSALDVRSTADQLMRTREITGEIISRHSGHTLDEVYEKTQCDSWFEAPDAVSWGLADRVITTL